MTKLIYTVFKVSISGLSLFPDHEAHISLLASERGLRYLTLPQRTPQAALSSLGRTGEEVAPEHSAFLDIVEQVRGCFQGKVKRFDVQLDLEGSPPFYRRAWEVISSVPYGEARSYAWVARQMGRSGAARGVGQAMARNPVPLIIPCHRCIGSDGGLHGFGGGLELKRWLLEMEGFTI